VAASITLTTMIILDCAHKRWGEIDKRKKAAEVNAKNFFITSTIGH
jgi:hypothetical protein